MNLVGKTTNLIGKVASLLSRIANLVWFLTRSPKILISFDKRISLYKNSGLVGKKNFVENIMNWVGKIRREEKYKFSREENANLVGKNFIWNERGK